MAEHLGECSQCRAELAELQALSSLLSADLLPAGLTFVSSSDPGNYTSGTGLWNVGAVSSTMSASLARRMACL